MSNRAVLCRTNAPLYQLAIKLLANNISIDIKVKEFSNELESVCTEMFGNSQVLTLSDLANRRDRLHGQIKNSTDASGMNRLDAIFAIYEVAESFGNVRISQKMILDLLTKLHTKTTITPDTVTLSTIHSSKGLEWNEVFVIRNDLIPHPATADASPAAKLAEQNLKYVAFTRAKTRLYLDMNSGKNQPRDFKPGKDLDFVPEIPVDLGFSPDQKEIVDYFLHSKNSFMINARAGSGKTFILRKLASLTMDSVQYIAFNKHIADSADMGQNVKSATLHSLLFSAIKYVFPNIQIDKYLVSNSIRSLTSEKLNNNKCYVISKMISSAKNRLVDFNISDSQFLEELELSFAEPDDEKIAEKYVGLAKQYLKTCKPNPKSLDFDDMLWWPAKFKIGLDTIKLPKILLIDEVQDFNACQVEFVKFAVSKKSRVIAVGDPNQAVYQFRGAGHGSFKTIEDVVLSKGGTALPIRQSFRTAENILSFVRGNTIVKDIYSNIPGGKVEIGKSALELLIKNS